MSDFPWMERCVFLLVSVVGVAYHLRRMKQLETQSLESLGSNLIRKQEAKEKLEAAYSKAKEHLRTLLRLRDSDVATVEAQREALDDFFDVLSSDVMPKFVSFMEWMHIDAKSDDSLTRPERLDNQLTEYLFPKLERFNNWRAKLNGTEFTDRLGRKPFTFTAGAFADVYRCLDGLPTSTRQQRARKLRELITQLCTEPETGS